LSPTQAMNVVKIEYQPRGYRDSEIMKLPALTVGELKIASGDAGNVVTGSVTNPNPDSVEAPIEITIFPLDSAGRPLDFGYVSSMDALTAGSSWTFTTTIRSPIDKYVAFAVYGWAR